MAYRFLREGLYTRRKSLRRNGFTPFVEDLMWTATDWHYQHYISRAARASLLTHQEGNRVFAVNNASTEVNRVVEHFKASRGGTLAKGTEFPFFRLATPNIVPYRRQSNPFCQRSSNRVGWQLHHRQLERTPRPYRSTKLGGTDLSVPVMPKH
ncbi:hypothetical protein, conserved [Babesia bigemina]|uniref:Uncharacterized protein n=1 Tax=Babesia bigemina TaxID=5866 RepID=A0A061DA46_BABBI|nr:hypothetical protein, conserved [Babesia bigemina]CDR97591.1 hypothetical protein, conserved [Babesia bigemina]|eukprot:XP_012769777.1 hypothetical protein, conserved [Babesia bigemina]